MVELYLKLTDKKIKQTSCLLIPVKQKKLGENGVQFMRLKRNKWRVQNEIRAENAALKYLIPFCNDHERTKTNTQSLNVSPRLPFFWGYHFQALERRTISLPLKRTVCIFRLIYPSLCS